MPKIVDHHRRREDLALLTLKVISAVGIENATLREIARRGGLSLGRLTHYFGSKDDLLAFAFRWLTEKSFAELDRLATIHSPGRPRMHNPPVQRDGPWKTIDGTGELLSAAQVHLW